VPHSGDGRYALRATALWSLVMPILLVFGLGRLGPDLHPSVAALVSQSSSDEVLTEAMELVQAFSFEAVSAMDGSTVRLGDGTELTLKVAQAADGVLQVHGFPADTSSGLAAFTTFRRGGR
jgi:hypothetical protein